MKTDAFAFLLNGYNPLARTSGISLSGRVRQYFRVRSDLRRLQALDDRMLADIGLSRSDVDVSVVRDGLRD
jgi:uncharacterized protein YjiS (DUF1127 family)